MLLIIEPSDPETNEITPSYRGPTLNEPYLTDLPDTNPTQISLHALMGQLLSQTLKGFSNCDTSR